MQKLFHYQARGRKGVSGCKVIHTQMTRLGDPMLDPGGEMDVSDVRRCCGREEDRVRGCTCRSVGRGDGVIALWGTSVILLKALSSSFCTPSLYSVF